MCWREREEGERETEDGNNSVSLKTNKANLNLRLRTSSLVFHLVRPPRRPFPAFPNQFNLSLLIPHRCSPSPFSIPPIRRSLRHTLTKADFCLMDRLCGCLCKSSVRSSCSESREAGSSPGDMCDIKRWKLKEALQSVIVLSFSVLRSRCVLATQRPVSHGNTAASTLPPRLSLLLFPSVFPSALLQQTLWFSNMCAASQASLQVLLSHIFTITPSSLSLHSILPSLFLPRLSFSLCLRWSSLMGRRQLAGCELAAMETGTLPLPQVSLATSSLAL